MFHYANGRLHCEDFDLTTLIDEPKFVYSNGKLVSNVTEYLSALSSLQCATQLNFSIKANFNPHLIKSMKETGLQGATCVSINEFLPNPGFEPDKIIFNGNGKTLPELAEAINAGVIINVDSKFDFDNIERAVTGKKAKVLIRVNPDIDPVVHPYISTGLKSSKFGIVESEVEEMAKSTNQSSKMILLGIHCHLGSTISTLKPIDDCSKRLSEIMTRISPWVESNRKIVNVGGGLGINYEHHLDKEYPTIENYVQCFKSFNQDTLLIFEPGRSLIANAGILIGNVIGTKNENCLVVDISMTECIRPALYSAYHHIIPLKEQDNSKTKEYRVVGPVCESADYLSQKVGLPEQKFGDQIVVLDVGAYCSVLGINYNMRPRRAEFLISQGNCRQIREADDFKSILAPFKL